MAEESTTRKKLEIADDHRVARRKYLVQAGFGAGAILPSADPPMMAFGSHQCPATAHNHTGARPFQFCNEPPRQCQSHYDLTDRQVRLACRAVGCVRNGNGASDFPKDHPLSVDRSTQRNQWILEELLCYVNETDLWTTLAGIRR